VDNVNRVSRHKITAGGQVSLPAAIRRRWGTNAVALEDVAITQLSGLSLMTR
jgi:hypothetical protein